MCDYTDPTYQVNINGSTKPIYQNSPTGRVEECNACLLHPECAGKDKDGCYQPCFGYEPITKAMLVDKSKNFSITLSDAKFNQTANTYEQSDPIEHTISTPWKPEEKNSWKYILFLKDPSLGKITGETSIVAKEDSTFDDPKDSSKKLKQTKLTITGLTFEANSGTTPTNIDVSLYRYRASPPADSGFEKLQDVYAPVFSKLKEIMDENNTAKHLMQDYDDINFYNIRKNDPDTIAKTLFESVKGIYNLNTSHVKTAYKEKQSKQKELEALQSLVNDKKIVVDDLKALNHTSKRQIEINMYKSKKMEDTNKALMIVMIVVGCLVIFPILAKTKIASIGVFVGLWIAALLIVLIYMFYVLYYKKIGQDELEYAKYNFNKPSDKEVALSIANATLNKKDKQRCQAFAELEEDLEIPNIEIDINDYNNATEPASKCGI